MDRAEVLHALSYDIELSWKNTPGEFELVKLIQKIDFSKNFNYIGPSPTATQHARGRIEYYSPRGKPSLRVTSGIPRSVNFASAKRF